GIYSSFLIVARGVMRKTSWKRCRAERTKNRLRTWKPVLERLEDRTLLSGLFVVTTTADSGEVPLSLRQAILDANSAGGGTIGFDIPTTDSGFNSSTGVWTIQPLSPLPAINQLVTINGYSQPGSSPNTLSFGDNAVLTIQLNGSQAGSGSNGFVVSGSD